MRRFATFAVCAGLAVTACAGPAADPDSGADGAPDPGAVGAGTTMPAPAPTTADTGTMVDPATTLVEPTGVPNSDPAPPDPVSEDDLVNFLASVETAIVETRHSGIAFDAPEIYIALGQAACARLSDGHTVDEIAADMLGEIDGGGSTDDERLVGAILGAATRTICTEHSDKI